MDEIWREPQAPVSLAVDILFSHCDPAGIVYYPNIVDMIEEALERWMLQGIGESYARWINEDRRALPRVDIRCRFHAPCRWGERLVLTVFVAKLGRSSIGLALTGTVDGSPRVTAEVAAVMISLDGFQSVPFPDPIRAKLTRYRDRFPAPAIAEN